MPQAIIPTSASMPLRHFRDDWHILVRAMLISLFALALTGCATRLLPDYDQATYQSLVGLNAKAQTLFLQLSGDGAAKDFPLMKNQYDELSGGFIAARMAPAVRPVPSLPQRLLANRALAQICGGDAGTECLNPSLHSLDRIVALLALMRKVQQARGLAADVIADFENQYTFEFNNILTFEAQLQR